jgi:hypothetical protein
MTEETIEGDPFTFDSTGMSSPAIMAFIYQESGAEGLRELLATLLAMKDIMMKMEDLEHDAAELHSLGLNAAADIVAEAAADAPSGNVCPFEPNTGDFRNWHRKRSHQPFETEQEAEQNLLNQAYRVIDTNYWTSHSGKVDAEIIPTADGFRIKRRLAQ